MPVAFPIRSMHVPLDIPFACSITVDPNGDMNKVRSGFPITKPELNDFHQSSIGRAKSGPERSRIPKRLPFKLGPFFRNVTARFPHPKKIVIGSLPVNSENGCNCRPFLSFGEHNTIE